MYRSLYGGKTISDVSELPRTVSLDEGLSSYNEGPPSSLTASRVEDEEKASEYIKMIFGDDLGVLLSECAQAQPMDPVLFLSDLLERCCFIYTLSFQLNV